MWCLFEYQCHQDTCNAEDTSFFHQSYLIKCSFIRAHSVNLLSSSEFLFPLKSTSLKFTLRWAIIRPSWCCNAVSDHPPTQGCWVSLHPANTRGECPHVGVSCSSSSRKVLRQHRWQKCQFNSQTLNKFFLNTWLIIWISCKNSNNNQSRTSLNLYISQARPVIGHMTYNFPIFS